LGKNENYEIKVKADVEIDSKNSKLDEDEAKETKISNAEIQCG